MNEAREIAVGVHWVGTRDWDRRLFDALIPLPAGTTYNSYLVSGIDKRALIDTVNPGFEGELRAKLEQLGSWGRIDYLIMNHAEPDHAGNIPFILEHNPKAMLVLTAKGAKLAKALFHVSEGRMQVVKDGDELSLGGKTLRFIEAPFLHWPETMFTYLVEDSVLFSCDFFGSHHAGGVFSDEVPDLMAYAKKYFGEIMMPFAKNGRNGLAKLEGLEIRMIAPSHGPIHDKPGYILDAYKGWVSDAVKNEVVLAYVSMHESTRLMADYFTKALIRRGIVVRQFNLAVTDLGRLAIAMVDAATIVLGSPTVLTGAHPKAAYAAFVANALRPKTRFASVIGSFGWGGKMVEQLTGLLTAMKVDVLTPVIAKGRPKDEDYLALDMLAERILAKHREIGIT